MFEGEVCQLSLISGIFSAAEVSFSALMLSFGCDGNDIQPVKAECSYADGGDLTGALLFLKLRLALPPPSSATTAKFRTV